MPFNGSGTWSNAGSAFSTPVTGTTISSTAAQTFFSDLASNGLSGCITKDGQTTVTSNIPFGGNRITGLGAGTDATDAARLSQIQDGASTYLTSVAGTNTITATATPTPAYAVGQRFVFVPANTNTGATTLNISSLGAGAVQSAGVGLVGGELVAGIPVEVEVSAATPVFQIVAGGQMQPLVDAGIVEGRLTLTTGVPVTTTDVTAAETVYFTPYAGNRIALYTGTLWKLYTFSELSVDVPDATQMNDVFIYDNAGTLTLDVTAWTNTTTRATALTTQNGVLVKSGATSRRYLGSFYSTTAGNGQTEDSLANRYVWNYYNRVNRPMKVSETTNSWTENSGAFRQANGSTANQLNMVIGVSENAVEAMACGGAYNSGGGGVTFATGIGVDSTTVNSSQISFNSLTLSNAVPVPSWASYKGFPGVGLHAITWLEYSANVGTTTWVGDNGQAVFNTGITGTVWG